MQDFISLISKDLIVPYFCIVYGVIHAILLTLMGFFWDPFVQ